MFGKMKFNKYTPLSGSGTTYYKTITIMVSVASSIAMIVSNARNRLISDIRMALRISSTDLDTEVEDLIDSVKMDLQLCGLMGEKIVTTDALVKRAITVYCKANFGWDNPDAEKLQKSYEMIRNHLTLSGDYSFYKISFDVGARALVTLDVNEKYTNIDGEVDFYIRKGNNYTYTVSAEGYESIEDVIDVAESKTITLVLAEV